jgi:hypothetical protein
LRPRVGRQDRRTRARHVRILTRCYRRALRLRHHRTRGGTGEGAIARHPVSLHGRG